MYDGEATVMGQSSPAKAVLVVRQGTQAGMSFPLTSTYTVLGREESVEIVLQDPEASRRHAQVGWQGGQFVLEDLGSTNGTFINGVQITAPQTLNPGDSIGIGQTALVFQAANVQSGNVAMPYANQPLPQQVQPPAAGYSGRAAYDAPANMDGGDTLQYVLYGFGCLFSLGICALSFIIALVLLYPNLFAMVLGA